MRISDWSSDVCSSDLAQNGVKPLAAGGDTLVAGLSLLVLVVVCQVAPPIPPLTRASANSDRLRKECITSDLAPPLATMKRSEEHTSELQSLMRISYAVFCLKKKTKTSY